MKVHFAETQSFKKTKVIDGEGDENHRLSFLKNPHFYGH